MRFKGQSKKRQRRLARMEKERELEKALVNFDLSEEAAARALNAGVPYDEVLDSMEVDDAETGNS